MGLWDTLTNVFTGQPAIDAAAQQRQYLQQIMNANNALYEGAQKQGLASLQSGQQLGTGAITSGVGQARSDISGAIDPAIAALMGGTAGATGALTAGQGGALGALQGGVGSAVGAYDPLAAAAARYGMIGAGGANMSADALGLNGPEGVARATAAFHTGPGYNFAVNQGLDALTRAANVGGGVAGGNVLRSAQTFGQGMADQEFKDWLTRVAGLGSTYSPLEANALGQVASGTGNAYLTGGTGAANIYTGTGQRLSDLLSGYGTNAANIYTGAGRSLADLAATGGANLANIYTGTSGREADLLKAIAQGQTGAQTGIAQQYAPTYATAAQAELGGSANLWNLIGSAAKLIAGGGLSGLGGLTPGASLPNLMPASAAAGPRVGPF
jgi:hypothetical protein